MANELHDFSLLPEFTSLEHPAKWWVSEKIDFSGSGSGFHGLKPLKIDFLHKIYPYKVFFSKFWNFEIFRFWTTLVAHLILTSSQLFSINNILNTK